MHLSSITIGDITAICGASLLIYQLRQNYIITRATFFALLNKELSEFRDIRGFIEKKNDNEDIEKINMAENSLQLQGGS